MKLTPIFTALALICAHATLAADKHDHAHEHKPLQGGIVVEVKDVDYELVAKPDRLALYLRDHDKPVDVSKASAKITLLSGGKQQEVELKAAGDKLEAKGSFNVAPGTKAVAQVSVGGKSATVKFVLK